MCVCLNRERRGTLEKIIGAVRYLVRPGVAFQGREANEGNLCHLVKSFPDDDPVFYDSPL